MLTKIADDLYLDLYEICLVKFENTVIKIALRHSPDIYEIDSAYEPALARALEEFRMSLCQPRLN
jgi:hypothetical protein